MHVFLVKVVNRSYVNVMRIRKMLVYCVKLDHALYSINYGTLGLGLLLVVVLLNLLANLHVGQCTKDFAQ